MNRPRIAFMGTPAFAVPPLAALVEGGYPVVAAFTQPDRPSGRGQRLQTSPVKRCAEAYGIPVYQFERVRRPEGLAAIREIAPDLIVTAAFGQILPQALFDIPRMGTVNVHASLLPKYRGAAPINWCIVNGETKTGVTTMLTDAGIDTGAILLRQAVDILPEEDAGALTERLSRVGARVLIRTIEGMLAGTVRPEPQDESRMSYQPMLKKEMGRIDFAGDVRTILNRVRGVTPWPGAFATLPDGGALKVLGAAPAPSDLPGRPGEVVASSAKAGLIVRCGDGCVELAEIQVPGSRRMPARAYLMGKQIPVGTVLNDG